MKKRFQYSLGFLGLSLLMTPSVHALIGPATTTGGTTGQTFGTAVQNKVFKKSSGTMFVGLLTGAGDNAISYASRASSVDTAPTFTGIAGSTATANSLYNLTIANLAVVDNPTTPTSPQTSFIVTATGAPAGTALYCFTGTAQNNSPQLATLTDGGGTVTTSGIMSVKGGLFGNAGYAFAAVKANSTAAAANFAADANDGVAIAAINPTTLAMTPATLQVNATSAKGFYAAAANATATGSPVMTYDETFGLLYVGLSQVTSGGTNGNAAASVAIFAPSNVPALTNIPLGSAGLATIFTTSQVIGSTVAGGTGAQIMSVKNLKVMHTSTSPADGTTNYAYLIVNGGNGASNITGNRIFALPLVVNNATANLNGRLASTTTQATYPFDTPVTLAAQLYTQLTPAARVGNGVLPMAATGTVNEMWVDGDAVYCSIGGAATATNCPGIWKSQALFDELGRITYWTDWTQVTPRGYTATGSNLQTATGFMAVDSYTGQIWANNSANTNLYLTGWNDTTTPTAGLTGFLNSNLEDGCFSVLDLNASTTNWGANNAIRMAAFGGVNTVCFALTGSAVYTSSVLAFNTAGSSSLINTATAVLTDAYLNTLNDYTATNTNIGLVTTLAGRVNCLGYSGWSANNASNSTPGFILAGTQPEADSDGSLYVYATAAGRGFNPTTDISDLKNGFFLPSNNNSWQELSSVQGTPVKIMSRGGALYVLTQSVSDEGRTDYIYRATICDTVTNLNNSFVAIATSGFAPSGTNSSLANATRFYDFVISSTVGGTTVTPTGAEQLYMITDDGIYTTTCANGTQTDYGAGTTATTLQLNAGWVQVADTDTYIEMNISEPARQRNPHTFWSSSFVQDADKPYYNSNVMAQTNLFYDGVTGFRQTNPSEDKSGVFNSNSTTSFARVPLLYSIYSDGSRRFVVYANNPNQHYLAALPYNVDTWNVTDPQAPIISSALSDVTAYYWIAQIGSSGILMAGTNTGVVALQ